MHKFQTLLRIQLKAMLSSFQVGGKKRSRAVSGIGALVLMAGVACYVSFTYSFLFAQQLAAVKMLPVLMLMMPLMAALVGFFFTVFAVQGVVFGGKDNDLVLALPVSSFTLMLSRTLALYLENLVFCIFVMLPAGAAYLSFGGGGGVRFALFLLLCSLFLALLPTLLALLCGFVLAWFSSKFARKSLFSTILYFAYFCVLMVGVFRLNQNLMNLAGAAESIQAAFRGWGFPFLLFQGAVCEGRPFDLIAFAAICLLPFAGAVWLLGRHYKSIVTGLGAKGARSDYRLGKLTALSQRRALFKKEAGRYFSSPIYIFNTGFGLVLMLIASVAALVLRGQLSAWLEEVGIGLPIVPILAAGLAFLMSTVAVTASSISLEGKYLWILKEAPVSTGSVFAAKVGFHLLLCLPCLLAAVVCLGAAFSIPFAYTIVLFLAVGAYTVFTALMGLCINLFFPKLDASNDTVVVKQSAAAVISTLGAMLLAGLGVAVYVLTWDALEMMGAIALCGATYAVGAAALAGFLHTKGRRMFEEL